MHRRVEGIALALIAGLIVATGPAAAYIDPNAGGFLFQMLSPLLALGAGAMIFMRDRILLAFRALNPFSRRQRKAANGPGSSQPTAPSDSRGKGDGERA